MRGATLRLAVAGGCALAAITETLSAFGALRRGPLLIAWSLMGAWGLWRLARRPPACSLPRPAWFHAALLVSMAAVAGLVGCVAVVSAPNSTDAMAYHLPRVYYWTQAASVRFYATNYLPQIMLQPFAEYAVLHTWIIGGGDRWANLVQFFSFLGCGVAVSAIARELGAGVRGQMLAALSAVTLPGAILQASGVKNELVLALWLAAMAYFALRGEAVWAGAALGLALLTKGTAYLFAPALLAGTGWKWTWRRAALGAACALVLNAPHYWRNFELSGSPLGFDSAHVDRTYRWRNEILGPRAALSNASRHLADQLGARSPAWNQAVYSAVVRLHRLAGMDPNDPRTTWRGNQYQPPRNANHETNVPNRWHLLLLALAAPFARGRTARYLLGVAGGFVLFCAYLKWQLFMGRMLVPLFILAAPAAGLLLERLRPAVLQAAVCLLLLNNTRPYLFENWARPLKGPRSVLRIAREDGYFADLTAWDNKRHYLHAVEALRASGCRAIGVDSNRYSIEYPLLALLPEARFVHVNVRNPSARYARPERPCAVVCLACGEDGRFAISFR